MSGMPTLPRGQKYNLVCCVCGSAKLVRGTTVVREAEDSEAWTEREANESVQEYQCSRQTCGAVSYLTVRVTADGATLQWRSIKNDPRTGRLS